MSSIAQSLVPSAIREAHMNNRACLCLARQTGKAVAAAPLARRFAVTLLIQFFVAKVLTTESLRH
jgi:hypothetical protein